MKRHWVTSGTVYALSDRIVRHLETCALVQSLVNGCVGAWVQVTLRSCACCVESGAVACAAGKATGSQD